MSSEAIAKFCQLWGDSLAAVVQQAGIAGAKATAAFAAEVSAPPSEGVAARFSCGGGLRGELLCHADAASALRLAQAILSEQAPADALGGPHRDAFLEMVRQAAGLVATGWAGTANTEALLTFQAAADPPFAPGPAAEIKLSGTGVPELALKLWLSQAFCEALELPPGPATDAGTAIPAGNLDLLLDVELAAAIRFGEKEMLLREVLGLMPGSVIELDQLVNEPADLLVAGRLVARGEVVVVDGNFGLRVTEVASKSQRASLVPL